MWYEEASVCITNPWEGDFWNPCFFELVISTGIPWIYLFLISMIRCAFMFYKKSIPIPQDNNIGHMEPMVEDSRFDQRDESVPLLNISPNGMDQIGNQKGKKWITLYLLVLFSLFIISIMWLVIVWNESPWPNLLMMISIACLWGCLMLFSIILYILSKKHASNFYAPSSVIWLYFWMWCTSMIEMHSNSLAWMENGWNEGFLWPFIQLSLISILLFTSFPLNERYYKSKLHHYQLRHRAENRDSSEEFVSSLSSKFFFSWMTKIIVMGYKSPLGDPNLWDVTPTDKCNYANSIFNETKLTHSLSYRLLLSSFDTVVCHTCAAFLVPFLTITGPYFLKLLLSIMKSQPTFWYQQFIYAVCLFLSSWWLSISKNQVYWYGRKLGLRVRSILIQEVYKKSLRRRIAGDMETISASTGQVTNLMSVDTEKLMEFLCYSHRLWNVPLQIILCSWMVYGLLGTSGLVGIGVMFAWTLLSPVIVKFLQQYQVLFMNKADTRVNAVQECLNAIRIVKCLAWESTFLNSIKQFRQEELHFLKRTLQANLLLNLLFTFAPCIVSLITFYMYTVISGQELSAATAFTAISLFKSFEEALGFYPNSINEGITAWVSFKRIKNFLKEDEVNEDYLVTCAAIPSMNGEIGNSGEPELNSIEFQNASFSWSRLQTKLDSRSHSRSAMSLHCLNLKILLGELTMIIGPTGSGKSSLLYAILGEMTCCQGSLTFPKKFRENEPGNGTQFSTQMGSKAKAKRKWKRNDYSRGIAFVSQQAWIQSGTVRENILFGLPFNSQRYHNTVDACGLVTDFDQFDDGDMTEIGEKGINLSGGQKQRLSLARAVYSNCPVVLLDDPLSALDSVTANHVYNHGILGPLMSGRTVVLVSNGLGVSMKHAAWVAVFYQGRIVCQGKPPQVRLQIQQNPSQYAFLHHQLNAGTNSTCSQLIHTSYNQVDASIPLSSKSNEILSDSVHQTTKHRCSSIGSPPQSASSSIAEILSTRSLHDALQGDREDDISSYGDCHTTYPRHNLITEEERAVGKLDFSVYKGYIKASGGWKVLGSLTVSLALYRGLVTAKDLWLSAWTNSFDANANMTEPVSSISILPNFNYLHSALETPLLFSLTFLNNNLTSSITSRLPIRTLTTLSNLTNGEFAFYFLILNVVLLIALSVSFFFQYLASLRASQCLHDSLFNSVCFAPLRFFDTTPLGRIMNRFSNDMQCVDQYLANVIRQYIDIIIGSGFIVIILLSVNPLLLLVLIPTTICYLYVAKYYLRSSRELKRLESILRSPLYCLFGETILGATTIRAYSHQKRFEKENMKRVDAFHRPYYLLWASNRWLAVRTEGLCCLLLLFTSVGAIASNQSNEPGLAGLALTYAMSFTDMMMWLVRLQAMLEMYLNSVERIQSYLKLQKEGEEPGKVWNVEEQKAHQDDQAINGIKNSTKNDICIVESRKYNQLEEDLEDGSTPLLSETHVTSTKKTTLSWPTTGDVHVSHLTIHYSPDSPPVLKDLSFHITSGQRVGVVGRTGAGKSTLASCFFRFVEASSGAIMIDNVNIATLPLSTLRSKLTMIPQDPTLFRGTVRSNLDPGCLYSDDSLYRVLQLVHLHNPSNNEETPCVSSNLLPSSSTSIYPSSTSIQKLRPQGSCSISLHLETPIQEQGANLSVGQRGLLAIARAFLRQDSKVVFIDEATAAMDSATDTLIQQTLRTMFHEATVFCIAHRLKTIVDYDVVMVLSAGTLIELGPPYWLMMDPQPELNMATSEASIDHVVTALKGENGQTYFRSGTFRTMCKESGEFDLLKKIAKGSHGFQPGSNN